MTEIKRIPSKEDLEKAMFSHWRTIGRWEIYRRQNAHTGPGLPASTEYMAIGENDYYCYDTESRGGGSPKGPVFYLRNWLRDLEESE